VVVAELAGGCQVYSPPLDNYNVVRSAPRAADAAFIARAREDVPALVAEVRLLRGLLADACHDGRSVARVVRLRREVAAAIGLLTMDGASATEHDAAADILEDALAADAGAVP